MNESDYLTLKNIADLLALLHETDSDIPILKPGTIGQYTLPDNSVKAYRPYLPTKLFGNVKVAKHSDVIAWIQAYKAAPKLGRRGDGSKQPKRKSVRVSKPKNQRGKRK